MSGAVKRPPLDDVGHHPGELPAAKLDLERLKAGVVRLPHPQHLQVSGALRALRGKPCLHTEAIARRHAEFSDSMGNGGTHEAWQAASNRLKLLCIQLNFDWQSSSFDCRTAPDMYHVLPSSLAVHEGQRRQYQYRTSVLAGFTATATNRGACHAA